MNYKKSLSAVLHSSSEKYSLEDIAINLSNLYNENLDIVRQDLHEMIEILVSEGLIEIKN